MDATLSGMLMLAKLAQSPKAYSPIEVRPSESAMFVKLEQFRNVLFPIEVTLLGIVILAKAVQSAKV
jgi:hypothetical protein